MPNPVCSILVVDDELDILLLLNFILKQEGYRVILAARGSVAESKAKKYLPDLIICDVMMPPPNGFELRKILAGDPETSSIPFIFLTARPEGADKNFAMNVLWAADYITKPFNKEELLNKVKEHLKRGK